ncbi:MAG TPA: tetratricopeptide repeat protein, partial [Bryobacteraceae bacterium]
MQIDSTNALALFHRGRCDILQGRLSEAAEDFAGAREKGLDSANRRVILNYASEYYNRAAAQFTRRNLDSALHDINIAVAIEPGSALYHFTKGEYCYALADHRTAIASYNAALQIDPRYVQAYYKQGMAWYELGEHRKAIDDFDAALTLSPQHLFALKGKGDALSEQKDYTHAVQNYESALRIASHTRGIPSSLPAELYNDLGYCYARMGEYEPAV